MGKMVQFLVLILSYIHFPAIIQNMAFVARIVQVKTTSRKKICLSVALKSILSSTKQLQGQKRKEVICYLKKHAFGPVENRKVFIYELQE